MECRSVMIGGIYNVENDSYFKNQDTRGHYYLVVGQYTKSNIGMVQCICITSMYGKEITTELPIVFRGKISYLVPYNIFAFPARDFDNMSYVGGLFTSTDDTATLSEFIELIYNINLDCVVYSFQNKNFHKDVEKAYNRYIDAFYEKNKDLREYRFDKFIKDGIIESEDKTYEKVYYGGVKVNTAPNVFIRIIDNEPNNITSIKPKELPIEHSRYPEKLSDDDLVDYYNRLLSMTASEFSRRYSIPSFNSSKKEKSVTNKIFYNNRHRAKTELVKRGLLNNNPVENNVITV